MTKPSSAQEADVKVARRLGLEVANPTILSNSNNVVLWLRPTPVVVKIATGHHQRLHLELSVARHLLEQNAPAVGSASDLPQMVHEGDGFEMTFWRYEPTDGSEPSSRSTAAALSELHQALSTYSGPLPSCEDELAAVSDALAAVRPVRAGDDPRNSPEKSVSFGTSPKRETAGQRLALGPLPYAAEAEVDQRMEAK